MRLLPLFGGLCLLLAACDTQPATLVGGVPSGDEGGCSVPVDAFVSGGVQKDAIPALTNPPMAAPGEAAYLADDSRVLGVHLGGEALAVPHNILWWHEIVNLDRDGVALAVTYCPLTGSSLVFDRAAAGGAAFGVSGLLFKNNLTMYDRNTNESLWPQMLRKAGCGPRNGRALAPYPVVEMTWKGWRTLYPDTRVLSAATGHNRDYRPSAYPYGAYEQKNNEQLLVPMPLDPRRPPKERVLGIPNDRSGIAFPFDALDNGAPYRVVKDAVGQFQVVVFWDREKQAAMAYYPATRSGFLTFQVRDGRITDVETGSRWEVDGRAVDGPLAGTRLEPVAEAYVAFWFAWATFQPEARLWTGS